MTNKIINIKSISDKKIWELEQAGSGSKWKVEEGGIISCSRKMLSSAKNTGELRLQVKFNDWKIEGKVLNFYTTYELKQKDITMMKIPQAKDYECIRF